ncbi:IS110 family transposase [Paenibacillus oleatilyticus]|uniref:Transposase n=1 Tax=Paenibacillus oleatilyticus TaxID=2594886 RepID=A0ABV4V350_9BACL
MESTGHYWFPLAAYLKEQGIKIVVVNPHHVNKSSRLRSDFIQLQGLYSPLLPLRLSKSKY